MTPLLFALLAFAAPVAMPPAPSDYVTDKAGVLSMTTASILEQRLRQFEKETSSQVLVYLDKRLPEGTTLEEFTQKTAESWGAGRKERDNGAVVFVFTDERAARIEVGYGLEGDVPDAIASRILREKVLPPFGKGDYDAGVTAGVDALIAATRGEYKAEPTRPAGGRRGGTIPWPLIFILVFFVLPALFGRRRRRYWYMGGGGWGGGGFGGFGGGWGGGGFGGGGGGGGGFSGGGGSFGGGGASGRW
jgi:uncharacterized protein